MADRRAVAAERRLRLLGSWRLDVDGLEVRLGGREQRLTSLLALLGRRARLQVAGILWPESTDTRALASLRRAVLLTQQRSPGLLRVDRSSIGLDPSVQVDVDELRAAFDAAGRDLEPEEARALLVSLSSGELLPGWYDDWLIPEREQLEQSRVRALARISRWALEENDLLLAVDAAQVASATEPLLESVREVAISAHLGRGDTSSALREFAGYRDVLRDELGVAPSHAIVGLIEHLLPGEARAAQAADPTPATRLVVPHPRAPIMTPTVTARAPAPRALPAAPASFAPPVPAAGMDPVQPIEPVTASVTTGTREAIGGIAALVAALLVVAAWLAVLGLEGERGVVDGGESTSSRAASSADEPPVDAAVQRKVLVRSGDTASGGVRFLLRATRRPTEVRLVMDGPSGTHLVRSVLVRRSEGHRLVLGDLDPGTYTWAATSASAPTVSGEVTVAPDEVAVAAGPTARPTPTASPAAAAESTPVTPSAPLSPSPTVTIPTPSPSHQAQPSGRPTDPGTRPPTPVG